MTTSDASHHLKIGQDYRRSKDYASAILQLKQALGLSPGHAEIHLELGRVYREMRDFDCAIKELEITIELGLDNNEAHLELGRTYREKEDYAKAIQELNAALKSNPSDGRIYLELGRVHQQAKDFDAALKELTRAVELGLDNDEVHLDLGRVYREKRQLPQAIKEFKAALDHSYSNSIIHFELGHLYRENKGYASAIEEFKKTVELGLDNENIHFELGKIYHENKEYDLAIEALKNALSHNPAKTCIYLELADIYVEMEEHNLAIRELNKAIELGLTALEINPQNGQPNVELAWTYEKKKEYSLAIEQLKATLRKGFDEECGRQNLLRLYGKQRVIEEFDKFIEINPYEEEGINLGIMAEYIFQEGYDSFIKKLNEIAKFKPENMRVHIELAWIYSWNRQFDLVIEQLKKISEIAVLNPNLCNRFSKIYDSQKERDLMIKEFKNAIQINSNIYKQSTDLKNEFILTLKDLFSDKTEEIDFLLKNPASTYSLYNWRYPAMSKAEGEILYLIARLLKPAIIIEAGTWMGTSTSYLAKACCDNKMGKVITVDKEKNIGYAIPRELLSYIEFHKGADIKDELNKICEKEKKIDVFLHDSSNSYALLSWEIEEVLPFLNKNGLIIAHDVYNPIIESPGSDVAYFFNEIQNKVKCCFFNTGKGLGVIKEIEKLELKR